MKVTANFYDINWEADDMEDVAHLPTEVVLTLDVEDVDDIYGADGAEILSNEFGFTLWSFNIEIMDIEQ